MLYGSSAILELIRKEPTIHLHAVHDSHKATWPGTAQARKAGPGNPGGGRRWEMGAAEVGGVIE